MSNYPIFSVLGIEIEYMLVNKDTLEVQPKSDLILKALAGQQVNEFVLGDIAASNELVMHVLELKNNGPKPPHHPVANQFQKAILDLQPVLLQHDLQLLPTGAHPWMNPLRETKRWPHGNETIYQQYNTIFDCQGHGWANLQSMHVNLPFQNDSEFSLLHNSVRMLLPLLPALAASTPILDGVKTGLLDSRLSFYSNNQKRIPSISGEIIPEFITSEAQYQQDILQPMYRDIAPFDPTGILQHEWLNSRAAIPKFAHKALEIRILDTQECVNADMAIAYAIHAILKSLCANHVEFSNNTPCPTEKLKHIYERTLKDGLDVQIDDRDVLRQWQLPEKRVMTVRDAWSLLIERVSKELSPTTQQALMHILEHGNLSQRILKACNSDFSKQQLTHVYRQLGDCLLQNQQFKPL